MRCVRLAEVGGADGDGGRYEEDDNRYKVRAIVPSKMLNAMSFRWRFELKKTVILTLYWVTTPLTCTDKQRAYWSHELVNSADRGHSTASTHRYLRPTGLLNCTSDHTCEDRIEILQVTPILYAPRCTPRTVAETVHRDSLRLYAPWPHSRTRLCTWSRGETGARRQTACQWY